MDNDAYIHVRESGESLTYPRCCRDVRIGDIIIIKDHACIVYDIMTSPLSRYGQQRAHIVGYDIFNNRKYEDYFGLSYTVHVPFIKHTEVELISVLDDGSVSYIDDDGENRDDLILESEGEEEWVEDLKKADSEGKDILITVLTVMGKEKIVGFREVTNRCF